VKRLDAFARDRGRTLLELAISGLVSQPGVASVVAGATSPEQVRANMPAGGWRLSGEEFAALARVSTYGSGSLQRSAQLCHSRRDRLGPRAPAAEARSPPRLTHVGLSAPEETCGALHEQGSKRCDGC
jgi:uncharacterized protein YfaP (DUF2135 family)